MVIVGDFPSQETTLTASQVEGVYFVFDGALWHWTESKGWVKL